MVQLCVPFAGEHLRDDEEEEWEGRCWNKEVSLSRDSPLNTLIYPSTPPPPTKDPRPCPPPTPRGVPALSNRPLLNPPAPALSPPSPPSLHLN